MTTRLNAPTVGDLVRRLRSAAAAAHTAEAGALHAFELLLSRAAGQPVLHAALADYESLRTGSGSAVCAHLGAVADALEQAADELEKDDALVAAALR